MKRRLVAAAVMCAWFGCGRTETVTASSERTRLDAGVAFDAGAAFDAGMTDPMCFGQPVASVEVIDLPASPTLVSNSVLFVATRPTRLIITQRTELGGRGDGGAALTIRNTGVPVCVELFGSIVGRGGKGGRGGNGGSGRNSGCARPGESGGAAISHEGPLEVVVSGLLAGGGGGGPGLSACNVAAGGGGGAGRPVGAGGEPATDLSRTEELAFCGQDNGIRTGQPGAAGTLFDGGRGGGDINGSSAAGAGGGLGQSGQAPQGVCGRLSGNFPGAAGAAVEGFSVRAVRTRGTGAILGRF